MHLIFDRGDMPEEHADNILGNGRGLLLQVRNLSLGLLFKSLHVRSRVTATLFNEQVTLDL